MFADSSSNRGPIQVRCPIHLQISAALVFQQGDGVYWQQGGVPFRPWKGGIGAALGSKFGGSEDRVIGDELHAAIGELHSLLARVADSQFVEGILKRH